MSALNVAIVQSSLHWHEPERNLGQFSRALQHHDNDTDLFVLPEMFATGFTMHAEAHAERMDGRSVTWMADTAGSVGAAICGSLIIEDGGEYFSSAIMDYLGNYLVSLTDGPAVKSATLEKPPLEEFRGKFPFHLDADAFSITDRKAN